MNPYTVLGISTTASQEDIERAYKRRCRQAHKDHGMGTEEYAAAKAEIQRAYDCLNDPESRRIFDETGEMPDGKAKQHPHAKSIPILSNLLAEVIKTLIESNIEPANENILSHMKAAMDQLIGNMKSAIKLQERLERILKKLLGKFKPKNPADPDTADNPMESIVRSHHDVVAKQMKITRESLERHKEAQKLLDKFDFEHEPAFRMGTMAWTKLITTST